MSAAERPAQEQLSAGAPRPEEQVIAEARPAEVPVNPMNRYLDAGDELTEIRESNGGRLPEGNPDVERLTAERKQLLSEINAKNAQPAQEASAAGIAEGEAPVEVEPLAVADAAEPEPPTDVHEEVARVAASSEVGASEAAEGQLVGAAEPEAEAQPVADAAAPSVAPAASTVDLGPPPDGEALPVVTSVAEARAPRAGFWQTLRNLGRGALGRGRRSEASAISPATASPEVAQPEAVDLNPYGDNPQALAAFRAAQDTFVDELDRRSKGAGSNDTVAAALVAYTGAFNGLLQSYRAKLEGEQGMNPEEVDAAVTKRKDEIVAQYNQRTAQFSDLEARREEEEPPSELRPAA